MGIIRHIILAFGIGALVLLLWRSWPEMQLLLKDVEWSMFVVSLILAFIGNLNASWLFGGLLKKYGVAVDAVVAQQLFFLGQIVKYIPGKVWPLLYQGVYLKGIASPSVIVISNVDLAIITILVTSIIGCSLLLLDLSILASLMVALIGMLGGIFAVRSCLQMKLFGYLFSKLMKNIKDDVCVADSVNVKHFIIYYVLNFFLYVTSSVLVLMSTIHLSWQDSLIYVAYISLAWVVGVLVFVMPAGMGIKEVIFVLLAGLSFESQSWELHAAIAILFRGWQIIVELCGAVYVGLVRIKSRLDI